MTDVYESRRTVFEAETAADEDLAASVRDEVQAFMRAGEPTTMAYLITLRKDGRPMLRPVATFVEGWTVGTISQFEHLKNQHIRNNPEVGILWTEQRPAEGQRPKNVYLQGRCEILDDPAVVADFFKRREAATGKGDRHPEESWKRLLLRTTPTLVRAEGFLGPLKPAVYRSFDSFPSS